MTKVMTSLPTSLLIFLAIELMDMDRNVTALRERFKAYKNGKPISEIYDAGLPKYATGKPEDVNDAVLDFIIQHEGFKPDMIGKDPVTGAPYVGSGIEIPEIIDQVKKTGKFSAQDNKKAVKRLVLENRPYLRKIFSNYEQLTPYQKLVLDDVAYNIGVGKLTKEMSPNFVSAVLAGDNERAKKEMNWGNHQAKGLVNRNIDRQAMWDGNYGPMVIRDDRGKTMVFPKGFWGDLDQNNFGDDWKSKTELVETKPIAQPPVIQQTPVQSTAFYQPQTAVPVQQYNFTEPKRKSLLPPLSSLMPSLNDLMADYSKKFVKETLGIKSPFEDLFEDTFDLPKAKNGKLPGFNNGKTVIGSNVQMNDDDTFTDDYTRVFDNFKVTGTYPSQYRSYYTFNPQNVAQSIKNMLYRNVDPHGYDIAKTTGQLLSGEREYNLSGMKESLWAKYLGLDSYNTYTGKGNVSDWIIPSPYSPTTGHTTYGTAYRLNPKNFNYDYGGSAGGPLSDDNIRSYFQQRLKQGKNNITTGAQFANSGLGYYTMGSGQDENGRYISYYDDWDINPFHGNSAEKWTNILPDAIRGKGDILKYFINTNPYSLYDRRYLTDEEWKKLGGYKNGKLPGYKDGTSDDLNMGERSQLTSGEIANLVQSMPHEQGLQNGPIEDAVAAYIGGKTIFMINAYNNYRRLRNAKNTYRIYREANDNTKNAAGTGPAPRSWKIADADRYARTMQEGDTPLGFLYDIFVSPMSSLYTKMQRHPQIGPVMRLFE